MTTVQDSFAATPDNPGWRAHPAGARILQAAIFLAPVLVGAVTAIALHAIVPRPDGGIGLAGWWVFGMFVCSAAVAVAFHFAQRALPLAALLRLSLVFPDRTPSRVRVAVDASSTERIDDRIAQLQETHDQPSLAVAAEAAVLLSAAIDNHDRMTKGHSDRVGSLSEAVARELGVSAVDRERLRWAAILHDCGKLAVEEAVLNKQGTLDAAEWEEVRRHPEAGDALIEPLREWLGPWALTVIEHHERWDGGGYPTGARGQEISLGARIVAVADSFDVMTSARSYKRPVSPADARAELTACAGTQFDPEVVRAFMRVSTGRFERLWPLAIIGHVPFAIFTGAATSIRRAALRAGALVSTGAAALASVAMVTGAGPLSPVAPSLVAQAPRAPRLPLGPPSAPYESIPVPLMPMTVPEPVQEAVVLAETVTPDPEPEPRSGPVHAIAAPAPVVSLEVDVAETLPVQLPITLPLGLTLELIPGVMLRIPALGL